MHHVRQSRFAVIGLAVISLGIAAPSYAQVTFTLGNNPQPGEENVLLDRGDIGNQIIGVTNQSNIQVCFDSTETLTTPASGQARIEGVDGILGADPLTISVCEGGTFGDLIFNPFIGGNNAPADNTLNVTANTSAGVANFSYLLSNGENFLTIVADAGVQINSIVLTPDVGFSDLRQIRISGVQGGVPPSEVPEPGAMLLLGATLAGGWLGLRRRRH
jgi:hypothetical protein